MGEIVEWIKTWGLIDWTWTSAIIFIILCFAAGFIVPMLKDQVKRDREKISNVPKLTDLYAELRRSAEAGDITAWADLGDALLYGFGCEQDFEKALEYFCKGAELGDKNACFAIFEMSSNGVSLVSDDEANAMLKRAAELGHGKAEWLLNGRDISKYE